jgi:hypothetical protein
MKTYKILFFVIVLSSFIACERDDFMSGHGRRVTGSGEIRSDEVYVDDFTSIDLQNVSNVYVEIGEEPKVVFTAYENILPLMEADVVGHELVLRYNRDVNVNCDKNPRVDITVPALEKVTLNGVGNFNLNGPEQESIEIELNGVGDVAAFELPVYNADIEINGNGNVEISALEMLEVDIDGMGNVYYQGDPEIDADIDGLGDVIKD